ANLRRENISRFENISPHQRPSAVVCIAAGLAAAHKIFLACFCLELENREHLRACFWKELVFPLQRSLGCPGNRASLSQLDDADADCAQALAAGDRNNDGSFADLHSAARHRVGTATYRLGSKFAADLE